MALTYTNKDDQQEPEASAPKHLKKETSPNQPDQSAATPKGSLYHTSSNESYSAPRSFDPSTPPLVMPSPGPTPITLPARSQKRDSSGDIKQMIAELDARADLAMSRKKAATPENWRLGYNLPSPGQRGNDWDQEILGKYPSIMSCSPRSPTSPKISWSPRTPRGTSSMDDGSKDVEEENGQKDNPKKHKRQGSLLEWRNKERFEEPVRI